MNNKLTIGAFLLMIVAFVVVLALPADTESIRNENREIATMPPLSQDTVFSGVFAAGVESVISDNIGCRSFFTDMSKKLENSRGKAIKAGKIVSTNKDVGTGTTQKQTLLVANDAIMEMFISNQTAETKYVEVVNYYAEKLPENIQLFNMLLPTQLEFKEPIYKNLQDSQKETIDNIYSELDSRVVTVDAYSELSKHSDEYIYFRTDHHWTPLGAYYGYRAFMNEEGGDAVEKDDYETGSIKGVLGYLYNRVSDITISPDTIEWYDIDYDNHIETLIHGVDENGEFYIHDGVMYDRSKANYSFFFGSDHGLIEMTNSENPNGKTLVVLRESYSNVLAPWLIESYSKVILVDPRICKVDFQSIIDKYNPDEVLITNYIFATNFADYCDLLINLYK